MTIRSESKPMPPSDADVVECHAAIPSRIIKDSLKMLHAEFTNAAQKYGPLHHQQLIQPHFVGNDNSCPNEQWSSANGWAEFATVNSQAVGAGWQQWHGPVEGLTYEWFGRFFGDPAGIDEFRFLADSLYLVLRKLDPALPDSCGFELLLDLMHQAAASWPTTFLRSQESEWDLDVMEAAVLGSGEATIAELDAIWNKAAVGPNGVAFFVHPTVETIQGNLFLAAAHFTKMIARDDLTLFLSDMHLIEPDYPIVEGDDAMADETNVNDCPKADEGDFVCAFDEARQLWHVRFRYDKSPDAVEEGWLRECKGMQCIAYLLERPGDSVPCISICPPPASERPTTYETPDGAGVSLSRNKGAKQAWEEAKTAQAKHKEQLTLLAQEIKEADEAGDEKQAAQLRDTFTFLCKNYNQTFDKYGRERRTTNTAGHYAANRVRNGINRLLDKCLGEQAGKEHALRRFAEHVSKAIQYNGGDARYVDTRRWQITYPLTK